MCVFIPVSHSKLQGVNTEVLCVGQVVLCQGETRFFTTCVCDFVSRGTMVVHQEPSGKNFAFFGDFIGPFPL